MNSTNTVVANAMAAHGVARNSVEVEVSLMYAGRVQHAMRDAARSVSGVRVTGTNTLSCPDEDAADEVVDILEQAGVPKREISLNAKRVARNANNDDLFAKKVAKLVPILRQIEQAARQAVDNSLSGGIAYMIEQDPTYFDGGVAVYRGLIKKVLDGGKAAAELLRIL